MLWVNETATALVCRRVIHIPILWEARTEVEERADHWTLKMDVFSVR